MATMNATVRIMGESLDDKCPEYHIGYAPFGTQVNPFLDIILQILKSARSLDLLKRHRFQVAGDILMDLFRQGDIGLRR